MIEIESSRDAYKQIAPDSYEEPIDVAVGNFGNPYDEVIMHLKRIANFSERQREKVAPDVIDLSPSSGTQTVNTYTTKTALRIMGIFLSGAAGDKLLFKNGTRTWPIYSAGNPIFFPFPITIQMGIDLSVQDVTSPAAVNWSFIVFGYAEG